MGKETKGPETDEKPETDTDETSTETASTESTASATETDGADTETDSTETETDSTETDTGDADTNLANAKKHSALWEKRAKENKTALDTALAETATLKQTIADFEKGKTLAAERATIAKDHGVPESALRGETADELTEHAKALQEYFPKEKKAPGAEGFGTAGESVHEDKERSAKELVAEATKRQ